MSHPTALPPGGPVELGDDEAPDFLERHAVALLAFVDSAQWASQVLRARLAVVAARHGGPGLGVGVVDVAHHRLVAEALGVNSVPTLILFADGEAVDRVVGPAPESVLDELVASRLPRT